MNLAAIFVAAIIPLIIGAIWYNKNVLGKAWMNASGITEEQIQSGNMAVIFGLTYLFGLFAAFTLSSMVIHQYSVYSLMVSEPDFMQPGAESTLFFEHIMERLGDRHRSFGHGALHGGAAAITFALPVLGIIAMFEKRNWKYVAIHTGYWFVTFLLMGGLMAAWK